MEVTTFKEYDRAVETTVCYPSDKSVSYVMKGLLGETGEINDKLKKVERGDFTLDTILDALLKEMGDVSWYMSRLASELGSTLMEVLIVNDAIYSTIDDYDNALQNDFKIFNFDQSLWGMNMSLGSIISLYGIHVMDSQKEVTDEQKIKMLKCLGDMGRFWTLVILHLGSSTRTVYDKNLNKLHSRKIRNVLKGEGDDR